MGEHWTVEVCEKCGKVHRSRRRPSCVVEYDAAGDTFAGTRTVEVVPRSRLAGAVGALRVVERALTVAREGYRMGGPPQWLDEVLEVARRPLGGQYGAALPNKRKDADGDR